jgi:YggT family protein
MLINFIEALFKIAYLLLFIRVLLSWIPHNDSHPIIYKIYEFTDPLLRPFQNIVPSWRIGIDLSPLFAFIALQILHKLIVMIII